MIFLDLRDRNGLVQVVFDPDTVDAFALADKVRSEYVVKVTGRVRMRDEAVRNSKMATGDIEVLGKALTILNEAATPPFELDEHGGAGEEVRLKYRYMDLRRPSSCEKLPVPLAPDSRGPRLPGRPGLHGCGNPDPDPRDPGRGP